MTPETWPQRFHGPAGGRVSGPHLENAINEQVRGWEVTPLAILAGPRGRNICAAANQSFLAGAWA